MFQLVALPEALKLLQCCVYASILNFSRIRIFTRIQLLGSSKVDSILIFTVYTHGSENDWQLHLARI